MATSKPDFLKVGTLVKCSASADEALASFDIYFERVKKTLAEIEAIKGNWLVSTH